MSAGFAHHACDYLSVVQSIIVSFEGIQESGRNLENKRYVLLLSMPDEFQCSEARVAHLHNFEKLYICILLLAVVVEMSDHGHLQDSLHQESVYEFWG